MLKKRTGLEFLCWFLLVCLFAGSLSGCINQNGQPAEGLPSDPDGEWWKEAVFYQVFVRSFYDSNGDGIGDFQGIIEKMDYLNDNNPDTQNDLGIHAIWLMPIHPSPSYHGYDVKDYYQTNPVYGTLDDFKRLLLEAEKRGIRVIIDLVINHTSTKHPWFVEAQDPESPKHDWYVWSDENPGFRGPQGQNVWHRAPNGKYYYALFWNQMPDLNFRNPEVTEEIYSIARYWLEDVGVDGFRIDGMKHIIEKGADQENTDETHAWLEDFQTYIKSIEPDAITVGEIWSNSFEVIRYVKNDAVDVAFNFDLARSILQNVNQGDAFGLSNTLSFESNLFPEETMGIFLSNHDQDRVMSVLMENEPNAKVAATIYLTSPGIPFLYYGEEIGLTGTGDHIHIRTPLHWSAEARAGFTTGTPWNFHKPYFRERNIAVQLENPDSLLSHYINLIHARNQTQAFQGGSLVPVSTNHRSVLAYLRLHEQDAGLVLINLSDQKISDYALTAQRGLQPGVYELVSLIGASQPENLVVKEDGGFMNYKPIDQLEPESSYVFHLLFYSDEK